MIASLSSLSCSHSLLFIINCLSFSFVFLFLNALARKMKKIVVSYFKWQFFFFPKTHIFSTTLPSLSEEAMKERKRRQGKQQKRFEKREGMREEEKGKKERKRKRREDTLLFWIIRRWRDPRKASLLSFFYLFLSLLLLYILVYITLL